MYDWKVTSARRTDRARPTSWNVIAVARATP
jgi:hypothetical protein